MAAFGEKAYPRPAAVILQYTGLSEVTGREPATYSCVGTAASWLDRAVKFWERQMGRK